MARRFLLATGIWVAPGKLMWDANKRRFSSNDEANKLLRPFLRTGWDLKV